MKIFRRIVEPVLDGLNIQTILGKFMAEKSIKSEVINNNHPAENFLLFFIVT